MGMFATLTNSASTSRIFSTTTRSASAEMAASTFVGTRGLTATARALASDVTYPPSCLYNADWARRSFMPYNTYGLSLELPGSVSSVRSMTTDLAAWTGGCPCSTSGCARASCSNAALASLSFSTVCAASASLASGSLVGCDVPLETAFLNSRLPLHILRNQSLSTMSIVIHGHSSAAALRPMSPSTAMKLARISKLVSAGQRGSTAAMSIAPGSPI